MEYYPACFLGQCNGGGVHAGGLTFSFVCSATDLCIPEQIGVFRNDIQHEMLLRSRNVMVSVPEQTFLFRNSISVL